MSGSERKNENEGEGGGGGGWSTFWKVAGAAAATAVVAGPAAATAVVVYSVLKQPKAEQVVVEAGGSSGGGAVWTPPKVGCYKLNVDGSLLRKIQSAGCGGVLRNSSGKWVGFAQKLEYSSSLKEHEPEIEGILKGLKWAKEKLGVTRVRKLEVESDNEGIVEKVNSWSRSDDPRIDEIRELLSSPDWQATLTSIPRSANGVADKLATIGSKNLTSFDLIEFDSPPTS